MVAELVAAGMPQWIIAAAVVVGLVGTLSEKAGSLSGPLGAPSRWWHARQEKSDRELDALVEAKLAARLPEAVAEAIAREREWMDAERARTHQAYERLQHDYKRILRELEELREAHRADAEYIARVTAWADAQAAYPGWSSLPPPKFPSRPVVRYRRRDGPRPREGSGDETGDG